MTVRLHWPHIWPSVLAAWEFEEFGSDGSSGRSGGCNPPMGLGSKPGAVDAGVGRKIVQRFELLEPAFLCGTDIEALVVRIEIC